MDVPVWPESESSVGGVMNVDDEIVSALGLKVAGAKTDDEMADRHDRRRRRCGRGIAHRIGGGPAQDRVKLRRRAAIEWSVGRLSVAQTRVACGAGEDASATLRPIWSR